MRQWLYNGRLLLDGQLVPGRAMLVEQGLIAAILPEGESPGDARKHDLQGAILAPGFIDAQVNGGGGVLFNDAPTVEGLAAIGAAHRRYGTTGFMPTLVSDDLDVIRQGIAAVEAAIARNIPGVLGIHVEGPFINPERKGIHDAGKIARLDEAGLAVLTSLRAGQMLVTLAPERTTPDMIRRLKAAGAVISGGHSNASYAETMAGIDAGISGFTHLFNAMSPLTSREPGMVGAALDHPNAICGIIVDGLHVSPVTLRLALHCKPAERFMLVTDAMPTVGMERKEFTLLGKRISAESGVCRDEDSGALAGSDLDMASALRNTVAMLGVPLETALAMASAVPANFLGLSEQRGHLREGMAADLVALTPELHVAATWIGGEREDAPPGKR